MSLSPDNQAAARAAEAAAAAEPGNLALRLAAAEACLRAGEASAAVDHARTAVAMAPGSFRALRTLSGFLGVTGGREEAINLARAALAARHGDAETQLHLGGLLLGQGRPREAATILAQHVTSVAAQPLGWSLLATALQASGNGARALDAVRHAVAAAPLEPAWRLQLASLLEGAGDYQAALDALRDAAALAPLNARIWRATSGLHEILGNLPAALIDAERAAELAPDDAAIAAHRSHVAGLCGLPQPAPAGQPEDWLPQPRRRRLPRPPRPRPGFLATAADRGRIIHALMLRDMRTRFGHMKLGYVWALLEPLSHLLTLGTVFAAMNHAPPPIGTSLFLYYVTGLLPYLMFSHVSNEVMGSVQANRSVLQLPLVRRPDVLAARAALQLATELMVGIVVFSVAALLGEQGVPHDPLTSAAAIAGLWLFAVGVGSVNLVVNDMFPSWDTFYAALVRMLYFASGIYYSPISMPGSVRDVLAWNPILQGIELFRTGFFRGYEPHWVAPGYFATCVTGVLLIGLCLERALRSRMRSA